MSWLGENRQWVFSGAGVAVVSSAIGGVWCLWKRARRRPTLELRIDRREARNALLAFADFCLKYRSAHRRDDPDRTQDLSAEINNLKSSIDRLGPLSMPQLSPLLSDLVAHAWNFQRLLDTQGGPDPRPIEPGFTTLEENLDGMSAWFADVKKRIKSGLDPYLEI